MGFQTFKEIIDGAKKRGIPFWETVMENDMKERDVSREESFDTMRGMLSAMEQADSEYDPNAYSVSGLAGGMGAKLEAYGKRRDGIMGGFITTVIEKAVKMAESNACMKRIVAAPTAGSCGVIPAVLLTYGQLYGNTDDELVEALYVAAGIGEVIAAKASISGAEGGCQAEIGSAAAMAAGALTYLEGGDNTAIIHAAALAIKNMLGLTCDPVAGLVEVPCIKRNAFGAVNAVTASHLALAGVYSAIDPDEVIESMRRTGRLIPECLRETSKDGLAITPSAKAVADRLK